MTNIASVAPSPAKLDSAITSMTRQQHHVMTNIVSAIPSPT
jgi:hypothetical protein